MSGKLILVPTPIGDQILDDTSLQVIREYMDQALIVVEEHKIARRRWLAWGLPREKIEDFILYNEHAESSDIRSLLEKIQQGQNILLMSDCGLPGFCDPGRELIDLCHQRGVSVTATYFKNSVVLALALSGFEHDQFVFFGFPPKERQARGEFWQKVLREKRTSIVMDTPYRLKKMLPEIGQAEQKEGKSREYLFALDLNTDTELLLRGNVKRLEKLVPQEKREFIIVVSPGH